MVLQSSPVKVEHRLRSGRVLSPDGTIHSRRPNVRNANLFLEWNGGCRERENFDGRLQFLFEGQRRCAVFLPGPVALHTILQLLSQMFRESERAWGDFLAFTSASSLFGAWFQASGRL